VRTALRAGVPFVGICRGHQLLNVLSGGSLYQDLDADAAVGLGHGGEPHDVSTTSASAARRLVGRRSAVPSQHHQGVRRLGRGLRVGAVSADGLIESIERTDQRFALGLQWKPQLDPEADASRRLAEALVEHARRRAA
jgi:putative glutamine amidotransferase